MGDRRRPTPGGYAAALVSETIAAVRTDLDAFGEAEQAVLENHGYLLADAAARRPGATSVGGIEPLAAGSRPTRAGWTRRGSARRWRRARGGLRVGPAAAARGPGRAHRRAGSPPPRDDGAAGAPPAAAPVRLAGELPRRLGRDDLQPRGARRAATPCTAPTAR